MINLKKLYEKYNFIIDIDGNFHKTIPKNSFIILISFTIIIIFAYIIIKIPYIPITIIGKTIYSTVIANAIDIVPYVFCYDNVINCYSCDNSSLFLEGINHMSIETNYSLIPLTTDEIKQLKSHTGLPNIDIIHNKIISSNINIESIIKNVPNKIYEPIISIKKISKTLYFIRTKTKSWITKLIITDKIDPINENDVITSVVSDNNLDHENYIIIENKKLFKLPMYKINPNSKIIKLNNPEYESIFYSLQKPRSFNNNFYFIHPFHLPQCWDIFLLITVITKSLISNCVF